MSSCYAIINSARATDLTHEYAGQRCYKNRQKMKTYILYFRTKSNKSFLPHRVVCNENELLPALSVSVRYHYVRKS